ncbi:GIY-YIG nuclease family protein [soil metagenome]
MAAWAYMLRCRDGSYYVGCTTDLDGRMGHHEAGTYEGYTSARLPVELVWADEFQFLDDAIAAERRVKGWSRAKKEALMRSDWRRVQTLARSYQHHGRPGASFDTATASPAQDDEG